MFDLTAQVKAELVSDHLTGKRKWNMVNAAWESQIKCGECPYRVEESTAHPCGEGWATETLSDCSLGRGMRDQPEDCAGYEIELESALDEVEAAAYEKEAA